LIVVPFDFPVAHCASLLTMTVVVQSPRSPTLSVARGRARSDMCALSGSGSMGVNKRARVKTQPPLATVPEATMQANCGSLQVQKRPRAKTFSPLTTVPETTVQTNCGPMVASNGSPGNAQVPLTSPQPTFPPARRPRATSEAVCNQRLPFPNAWPQATPQCPAEGTSVSSRSRAWTVDAGEYSLASKGVSIAVIAPGGGTGANSSVYNALGRRNGVRLEIKGQARAPYDRYPASWKGQGAPAPNLESFANEQLVQGITEQNGCLIFGSRGGQVVLPYLWKMRGAQVPPAVVINGGCAMYSPTGDWALPAKAQWPDSAVTFLLLGGQDYFKGPRSVQEYMAHTKRNVPQGNRTTAILLVNEMSHMPQSDMLMAALEHLVSAVVAWKASSHVAPTADFERVLNALKGSWSGQLAYTSGPGSWEQVSFGNGRVQKQN